MDEDACVVALNRPIARQFAGKYEVTFDEWDACVAGGGCARAADDGWGPGRRPVIHVSYEQAIGYTRVIAAAARGGEGGPASIIGS